MFRPAATRFFAMEVDDVPEAKIATGDMTFDDSEFQNWVSEGQPTK